MPGWDFSNLIAPTPTTTFVSHSTSCLHIQLATLEITGFFWSFNYQHSPLTTTWHLQWLRQELMYVARSKSCAVQPAQTLTFQQLCWWSNLCLSYLCWLLQVLRYSALGAGIFYGLYHQAKLTTASKLAAIDKDYQHKQSLIEKAKAEYTKKNLPPSAKTEGGDSTF